MKVCRKCGNSFGNWALVDGERKNLHSRKFCLVCSPWGSHNTRKLEVKDGYKKCGKCNQEKPISEFCKKTDKYLHSYCKPCLYAAQVSRWKTRKRRYITLKGSKCSICGYDKNFSALHFHHNDPNFKEFDWATMRVMSDAIIMKELDKCKLLCSNCHAELHNPECKI